jgi:hypothetical protein
MTSMALSSVSNVLKNWDRHRDATVFSGFSSTSLGASPISQRTVRARSNEARESVWAEANPSCSVATPSAIIDRGSESPNARLHREPKESRADPACSGGRPECLFGRSLTVRAAHYTKSNLQLPLWKPAKLPKPRSEARQSCEATAPCCPMPRLCQPRVCSAIVGLRLGSARQKPQKRTSRRAALPSQAPE